MVGVHVKFCFSGNSKIKQTNGIPCALKDYIELVDQTRRCIREDKRGAIALSQSPILERLKIPPEIWLDIATTFEASNGPWIGKPNRIKNSIRCKVNRKSTSNTTRLRPARPESKQPVSTD